MLAQDNLRQLRQRIALRHHVAPLAAEEVGEYIEHRLHVAGSDGRIQWHPEALALIYEYSCGVPRLINVLCDKALLAGYATESFTIDAAMIQRAIDDTECRTVFGNVSARAGGGAMSLVHEALQKAEREKQRKTGDSPIFAQRATTRGAASASPA